jgi:membrane protein DedA with SNARE-associated domain
MWDKIVFVYLASMLKFILGPIGGYGAGLNLLTTILATVAGMMTVVFAIAFFGNWLRNKIIHMFPNKAKKFSERNRRFVGIWKKYGIAGVAALTPLFLTPIGGTVLAISFGTPKDKLIIYMFISASVWAVIFSTVIYLFGDNVLPDVIRPER